MFRAELLILSNLEKVPPIINLSKQHQKGRGTKEVPNGTNFT